MYKSTKKAEPVTRQLVTGSSTMALWSGQRLRYSQVAQFVSDTMVSYWQCYRQTLTSPYF